MWIASDHLFNQASHLVARSSANILKLHTLEQKLLLDNELAKQQCLQVRNRFCLHHLIRSFIFFYNLGEKAKHYLHAVIENYMALLFEDCIAVLS